MIFMSDELILRYKEFSKGFNISKRTVAPPLQSHSALYRYGNLEGPKDSRDSFFLLEGKITDSFYLIAAFLLIC